MSCSLIGRMMVFVTRNWTGEKLKEMRESSKVGIIYFIILLKQRFSTIFSFFLLLVQLLFHFILYFPYFSSLYIIILIFFYFLIFYTLFLCFFVTSFLLCNFYMEKKLEFLKLKQIILLEFYL